MKVCFPILAAAVLALAACQQTTVPTASYGEGAIDPVSRNVMNTQGSAIRDPYTLSAPPIRQAPPEIATEGR